MQPRRRHRWRVGLLLLAVWLGSPWLAAQGPDREAELEEIRAEIARLQARTLRLRDREVGLSGELERIGLRLELQEKRVQEARAEREIAESLVEESSRRIGRLEQELESARLRLRRRLVELYRVGRDGPLRLLFSIRSRQRLLPGIRLLRYLARREGSAVEEYLDRRTRLAFERDQQVEQRARVEALLESEQDRLRELRRIETRQSLLLASLGRERRTLSTRTEELVDKERKLANLVDLLYGRNPTPLAGTPMTEFRGVLDWPIHGRVSAPFGPRLDPQYGTKVPHNGIDISTIRDQPVRVVFPGRVLFSAPFQGFGATVVVQHPGRVFTLYAGLSALRVVRDDMLSLGQVVGLAGDRLYFEIRVENRPENPLGWIRRARAASPP